MNAGYLYGGAMFIILLLAGSLYANIGVPQIGNVNAIEGMTTGVSQIETGNVGNGSSDDAAPIQVTTTGKDGTVKLSEVIDTDYHDGDWENPFGNVMLPEIKYDVDRKSAPPSFNPKVSEDITHKVKRAIQKMNPGIHNTNKQLFGDLYNNFVLDNANRAFYSTASTRIENDQNAFAKYLYHDLIYSGKESTPEGAIARVQDNYRYILY
jgi:hypothetical protein